jgi:uncharacterized protein (TIGR03437 family)
VPVGGAGVQVDANGAVYAGGGVGSYLSSAYAVTVGIPALANIPNQCLPNNLTIMNSAYVSQVDADSGKLLGTQFIGGSNLTISSVALSGSTLWVAGVTDLPDFPFTPNALTPTNIDSSPLGTGVGAGAYLGAVDFSQPAPPAGTPQIACVLDAADMAPAGPVARYQILSIFGTGLGPAKGVSATDYSTDTLGGVNITVGTLPAPLLYASSAQINFAVPLVLEQSSGDLAVLVNGATAPLRQLPLTYANPSLFINPAQTFPTGEPSPGFIPMALNADGSVNTSTNPAPQGSVVSVFVNGLAPDPSIVSAPIQLSTVDGWAVTNVVQVNPFVLRVDARVPPSSDCNVPLCRLTLYSLNDATGDPHSSSSPGQAFGGVVYVQ